MNPMTAVAAIRVADQLHIIDEFYMANCNTYDLCQRCGSDMAVEQ